MATVIGVRFKKAGKVYYFDPNDFWPKPGDSVVVETMRGLELGEVVTSARTVADGQVVAPLKKVVRLATEEDIANAAANEAREAEAMRICQEKIAKHGLEMKLVSVEYTFDHSKIIFYFTADGRVDFRELVKDLASVFHTRIELRQIGVRDEAKMLGGLGSCGRPICCGAFLRDFQPVSIKMAKEQNLSLNPTKISGLCGRLMCCLKYEQENYELVLKRIPRVGKDIVTPDGIGIITEINAIKEWVRVRLRMPDDTFAVKEYPIDDVRRPQPGEAAAEREAISQAQRRRQQQAAEKAAAEAEAPQEEPRKRRYPHGKVNRTMSTEQFLEQQMHADPPQEGAQEPKRERRRHKPRASAAPAAESAPAGDEGAE